MCERGAEQPRDAACLGRRRSLQVRHTAACVLQLTDVLIRALGWRKSYGRDLRQAANGRVAVGSSAADGKGFYRFEVPRPSAYRRRRLAGAIVGVLVQAGTQLGQRLRRLPAWLLQPLAVARPRATCRSRAGTRLPLPRRRARCGAARLPCCGQR
jgi:hypothetical protein